MIKDIKELIKSFYTIREISYRIPLSLEEEDQCCSGKAKQLFAVCEHLGIPCKYRVCEFLWSDLPLPEEVASIAHDDLCTHVFLELQVENERIYVDPTRDSGLKNIFHINERDGISSTYFAVKPIRFYDLPTSHEIMTGVNTDKEKIDDLAIHAPFYKALNNWFVSLRSE